MDRRKIGEGKNKYMMQVRGKRKFNPKDLEPTGPSPTNVILETIGQVSRIRWYERKGFLKHLPSLFLEAGISGTKIIDQIDLL